MKISFSYSGEYHPELEVIAILDDGTPTPDMIRVIAGLLTALGYIHDDIYATMVAVGEEMLDHGEEEEPEREEGEPPSDERDA